MKSKISKIITHTINKPIFEFYNVEGNTYKIFKKNLDDQRKKMALNYQGYTQWRIDWFTENTILYIRLFIIIYLPKSESNNNEIKLYLDNLQCHELVHYKLDINIFNKEIKKLKEKLPLTEKKCNNELNKILKKMEKENINLDNMTNHGCIKNKYCNTINC